MIKDLPKDLQNALKEYFYNPYPGYVYIYNSILVLKDIENHNLIKIMRSNDAIDGKPQIWSSIFATIFCFTGLEPKNKKILDVGSRIGHFAIPLAETGMHVTCVEALLLPCRVIRAIQLLRNQENIMVINSTIQEYLPTSDTEFDLAMMLNVFDHILRQGEEEAWKVLDELSKRARKMALMMGPTDQVSVDGIPGAVMRHSRYKYYTKLLSNSYGGRDLWGFTR